MKNNLFIGLGGQGGNTIAQLRKVLATRDNDVASLNEVGTQWDFLYIDSSRDVSNVRKSWTHFGQDLSLNPDSFLYLKEDGAGLDADALAMKPDVAPWIGDTEILQGFLAGAQGIVGANQRRRLGRLLFARNADRIKKAVCEDKIAPMLSASNRCAIHIFTSLAGGTGSGCLIDLITMLRKEYPNSSTDDGFPIFLYLYTADLKFEESQVGYFHENQSSVLRDLNALTCEKYSPHALGAGNGGNRVNIKQPVTQISLSSHLSSQNQMLSLQQQHQIVAEGAFERLYSFNFGNLGTDQQKAVTGEDKISSYPGEPTANPLRSFRFGSLGMRRWEVPSDEIKEALAADLSTNCLSLLLYQNWGNSIGAIHEKLTTNIPGYSQVSNDCLALIDQEKVSRRELQGLIDSLEADANRFHEGQKREGFKNLDLNAYEQGLRERFQEHLNTKGLDATFQEFRAQRGDRLQRIEEAIHTVIREAWSRANSPLGLAYVKELIEDLQQKTREEIVSLDNVPSQDRALKERMSLRSAEWDKLTLLSRPFRQEALCRAQRDDTLSILRQELRYHCSQEDRALLDDITKLLGDLASNYRRAADFLIETAKEKSKRKDQLMNDLRALHGAEGESDNGRLTNRAEMSIEAIDEHLKEQRLEKNAIENACSELIEKSIIDVLGKAPLVKLAHLTEPQHEQFEEVHESVIFERTKEIHDVLCQRSHRKPVLSGHILDILEQQHKDDPERFKKGLKSFIDSACSSVKLRVSEEIQPKDIRQDSSMPSMPRQALVIGLPKDHAFAQVLQSLINPLMDAGSITRSAIYFHDEPNQIRMLTLTYWMAARYAQVVHGLEKIYTDSLANDTAGDKAYFTNLDDSGEKGNRPPLLLPTADQARSTTRASLWLAPKLLTPGTDEVLLQETTDGVKLIHFSEDRGIEPKLIGDSLDALSKGSNIVTASILSDAVSDAIGTLNSDEIQTLKSHLDQEDATVRAKHGAASREYAEWVEVRKLIQELIGA